MKKTQRYKLDPILEVILKSTQEKTEIIKEFFFSREYFLKHPGYFFDTLFEAKDELESIQLTTDLTDDEHATLQAIYEALDDENLDIELYFQFSDDLILDSFEKIYRILRNNHSIDKVKNNQPINLLYYSMSTIQKQHTKLSLNKLEIKPLDFLFTYQALYN